MRSSRPSSPCWLPVSPPRGWPAPPWPRPPPSTPPQAAPGLQQGRGGGGGSDSSATGYNYKCSYSFIGPSSSSRSHSNISNNYITFECNSWSCVARGQNQEWNLDLGGSMAMTGSNPSGGGGRMFFLFLHILTHAFKKTARLMIKKHS